MFLDLQEFRRLDSQLGAARDRAELLAGGAENLPLLSVQVHNQSSTGQLLRERATLSTSANYVSTQQKTTTTAGKIRLIRNHQHQLVSRLTWQLALDGHRNRPAHGNHVLGRTQQTGGCKVLAGAT